MKATGVVRNIDQLGRIVIPKEIRRSFDIPDGSAMEIFTAANGHIVLRRYRPGCVLCGETDGAMKQKNGVSVCQNCLEELQG